MPLGEEAAEASPTSADSTIDNLDAILSCTTIPGSAKIKVGTICDFDEALDWDVDYCEENNPYVISEDYSHQVHPSYPWSMQLQIRFHLPSSPARGME